MKNQLHQILKEPGNLKTTPAVATVPEKWTTGQHIVGKRGVTTTEQQMQDLISLEIAKVRHHKDQY